MNGGEVLVATLLSRGIDALFFVAGGTHVTVLEALSRHRNAIRAVPMRLESSATFAAEAYGAIRKRPACVLVSRAPGATNAAIGVHTAMQGSRPLVLFISDIPRPLKQRETFQEADYRLMYASMTKAVFEVHSFDEVAPVAARALDLAVNGRPGPVVVAISNDILDGRKGEPHIPPRAAQVRIGADVEGIARVATMLREAKRPIVVAGEMVTFERAHAALVRFAEASGAGVMAAYRQPDVFPNDHPAWLGQLALNRTPHQGRALAECDLLIAVGTRLDSVTTADYSMVRGHHGLAMIYPEPDVFSQWQPEVALGANVGPALGALTGALDGAPPEARVAWRSEIHEAEFAFSIPGEIEVQGDVDLGRVVEIFETRVPDDAIIVCDAGTFGRWVHRYYRFTRPDTSLGPVSGAMGYGVPGGIGAAIADPERPVFVWVGDGGFLMTGHEAATIVQERLPVKIIICDNQAWGSILVHQQKRFPGWDFGVRLKSPDFAVLGEGYGIPAFRVCRTEEFEDALEKAMAEEGPALVHLILDIRDVSPYTGSAR